MSGTDDKHYNVLIDAKHQKYALALTAPTKLARSIQMVVVNEEEMH